MIKTLEKDGDGFLLSIDQEMLDLLGANEETPFDISTDGEVLILSPVRDKKQRQKFIKALEEVNVEYSDTLKKLAEF